MPPIFPAWGSEGRPVKPRFYTMLELVSAVLLIALISAVAAGRLRPAEEDADMALAAEKWREFAASARLRAISSGEPVRVCFSRSDGSLVCDGARLPLPVDSELLLDGEKIGPDDGDEVEIMTFAPDGRGRLRGETSLLCGGEIMEMRLSFVSGFPVPARQDKAVEHKIMTISPGTGNEAEAPRPLWLEDGDGER